MAETTPDPKRTTSASSERAEPASTLRLSLFGSFQARLNEEPLGLRRVGKGSRLLACLALRAGRDVDRGWLSELLWEETDHPRDNLKVCLGDLRRALGAESWRLQSPHPVSTLLFDATGADLDVTAFDAAIAEGKRGERSGLERAVALHRGSLLEEWEDPWVRPERQERKQQYLVALERLGNAALERDDYTSAREHLSRLRREDWRRESALCAYMKLLAATGDFVVATGAYERFALRLRKENAQPSADTEALYRAILEQQRRPGAAPSLSPSGERGAAIDTETTPREEPATPRALAEPHGPQPELDRAPATASLPSGTLTFLFTDIEGSTRLWEEQHDAMQSALARHDTLLREVIQVNGGVVFKTGGDGFCAVFRRAPDALAAAISTQRALGGGAEAGAAAPTSPLRLPIRMALHTGTAEERGGDYFGPVVNRVARLLSLGVGGQILLTQVAADLGRQRLPAGSLLHDLGEHALRGVTERVRVFQLAAPGLPHEIGLRGPQAQQDNPPVQPREPIGREFGPATKASEETATLRSLEVSLLHKRDVPQDERVLALLEERLSEGGHTVFVDRRATIGAEWCREMERRVRAADAVIPLLSEASVRSDLFQYEVESAQKAAAAGRGKPRLLPVRVDYADPLPEPLASLLNRYPHASWNGPEDDERLTGQLLQALSTPPPAEPLTRPPGGIVPLDAHYYIERPTDADFLAAIDRDNAVLIKGARQMGKTSLLERGLQHARERGARTVRVDLQSLDEADFSSAEAFFLALGAWIAYELKLDVYPQKVWDRELPVNLNITNYMEEVVLGEGGSQVVLGLDEVDRLFPCPFRDQVFMLLRTWFNKRSQEPWSRLTLALAYATEAHLFIQDLAQSPFNVGTRLALRDFSRAEVAEMNERCAAPLRNEAEIDRYHQLVSGHPYLIHRGLYEMATRGLRLQSVEATAAQDHGLFGDHLRRLLTLLQDFDLWGVTCGLLRGEPCPTEASFLRLRAAGVVQGEDRRRAQFRCPIYSAYLREHLQ